MSSEANEVTATDEKTGGKKGRKLARYGLVPGDALLEVAEHFGFGATKYEDRNWEKGYPWSWSFDAMMRHAWAWWQGEELDEEGRRHATAVAWHALVLLAFSLRDIGTDDRPPGLCPVCVRFFGAPGFVPGDKSRRWTIVRWDGDTPVECEHSDGSRTVMPPDPPVEDPGMIVMPCQECGEEPVPAALLKGQRVVFHKLTCPFSFGGGQRR